jgi:hypothetical protein
MDSQESSKIDSEAGAKSPINDSNIICGKNWASFADDDYNVWNRVIGARILHQDFGEGTVQEVLNLTAIPLILISFASRTEKISATHFRSGRININLLELELILLVEKFVKAKNAEIAAAELALKEAKEVFRKQAEKYHAPTSLLWEKGKISLLVAILDKLESRDDLTNPEINWLEKKGLQRILATYFYRKYSDQKAPWDLISACRYLNDAEMPSKVIDLSQKIKIESIAEPKAQGALLTTKGRALRKLNQLDDAKTAATEALEFYAESYHAHNLLGAISYQLGLPSEGDRHFAKAIALGSSPRFLTDELRRAISRSTPENRKVAVDYLLSKDPIKYSWVEQFT